jgi:hypothetical protein
VASFPLEQKAAIIEKARVDRGFGGELIVMTEIQRGDRQVPFRPSIVSVKQSAGIRYAVKVALVSVAEFTKKASVPPHLESKKPEHTIFQIENDELEQVEVIAMTLESVPEGVHYIEAERFRTTETEMLEWIMQESQQVRAGQPLDVFKWGNAATIQSRPQVLRMASAESVMKWDDWVTESNKVQAGRVKAEKAAAAGEDPAILASTSSGPVDVSALPLLAFGGSGSASSGGAGAGKARLGLLGLLGATGGDTMPVMTFEPQSANNRDTNHTQTGICFSTVR